MKFYTSGNYFYVETPDGVKYSAPSKNVAVTTFPVEGDTVIKIGGVPGFREEVKLSGAIDQTGSPYTFQSFTTFYEAETGS